MALAVAPTSALDQALIKAVGLDRVPAEQRTLALHIAERYDLDLMLKHLVMVDGRPYITRDGLLHVAHRSGQFDGIEVSKPVLGETHWEASATVWRKDMTRGFTYWGRYPKAGGNQKYAPEMATKVAECMALRRAFDVAAPVVEERWDLDEVPTTEPRPVQSLAAKAEQSRARIEARTIEQTGTAAPVEPPGATVPPSPEAIDEAVPTGLSGEVEQLPPPAAPSPQPTEKQCTSLSDPAMPPIERCRLFGGHKGAHRAQGMSWPQK